MTQVVRTLARKARNLQKIMADFQSLISLRLGGYLCDKGWWESQKKLRSVDRERKPVPWLTYPFVDFISDRVDDRFTVFEFGCGNSTLWLAALVNLVISCENNREWFENIGKQKPPNVTLVLVETQEGESSSYSREVLNHDRKFDVILIDGIDREQCASNALLALKKEGVIVWDNTDRGISEGMSREFESLGFKRIDFWGMGPGSVSTFCTSVFYRNSNCLNL